MEKKELIRNLMNKYGACANPFVFLIDFLMEKPLVFNLSDEQESISWQTPKGGISNIPLPKEKLKTWNVHPVSFQEYCRGFNIVQSEIKKGNTYLLNFTQPTPIETNLTLEDIFSISKSPYKILLKNKFVCFSPEPFIKIENGKIYSFPMKGTIDDLNENACDIILSDEKELAEHSTIVDLIRNDLSLIAENVKVEAFRYLQKIQTHQGNIWQVSSRISGDLATNYRDIIGDIIFSLLPAGSVSGAPKDKTMSIISSSENYERGYYTGIFGYFDGKDLDSCVLIRFIENNNGLLTFKSGGGITFMSDAEMEYNELLKKIYVPVG